MDKAFMTEALTTALAAVSDAAIPEDLREVAFSAVLAAALGGGPKPGNGQGEVPRGGSPDTTQHSDVLAAVAVRFGVSEELIHDIFTSEGPNLDLVVPTSKLEKAKSTATRQIALLVAAGRQAAGLDAEWTSSNVIRAACADFGRLDAANFASALDNMGDGANIRGKGKSKEIRINRKGFEQAGLLVQGLMGVVKDA